MKEYYKNNKDKIKEYNKFYRENNKDDLNKKRKEYYINNKNKIKEINKLYNENNKEKIKQKDKEYYEKNKDKIKEKNKERKREKITCECGSITNKSHLRRHEKSKKHLNFINQ